MYNLNLNITRSQEMIMNFRKSRDVGPTVIHVSGEEVVGGHSFRCLGVYMSADRMWSFNINHQ